MNYTNIASIQNMKFENGRFEPGTNYNPNDIRFNPKNTNILGDVILSLQTGASSIYSKFLMYFYYNWLPDYFFTTPASSTGKYHPAFANRENGLVLHSLAVVEYAKQILECIPCDNETYDRIIVAAFIHDAFKYGDPDKYTPNSFTVFEHPILVSKFLQNDYAVSIAQKLGLTMFDISFISDIVASHMGPWNTNKHSNTVLPVPKSQFEMILHKADYFASMKEGAIVSKYL